MWKQWLEQHKSAAFGLISGTVLGFIYLFFGFWNMLIFAFIVFLCYYIGRRLDGDDLTIRMDWLERAWNRLMQKWNMFR